MATITAERIETIRDRPEVRAAATEALAFMLTLILEDLQLEGESPPSPAPAQAPPRRRAQRHAGACAGLN